MRRSLPLAMLAVCTCCLAPARLAGAEGATREDLDKIVEKLRGNAELWLQGKPPEAGPEIALKRLWFDAGSVGPLNETIRSIEKDPNGLYVISRLLHRLSYAEAATIRAALPSVKDLHSSMVKTYRPFPKLSKRQIKALKKPSDRSSRARAALEDRRKQKLQREKPIAQHNEMVYALERVTFLLMILAATPEEDRQLAETLVRAEKQRSAAFLTVLNGMAGEARKMGPKRGEAVYEVLRPHALEIKWKRKRPYTNPGKAVLRDDDVSTYEQGTVYPGITMLKTLNRIATAAKLPALKVPRAKDVAKHHKELEKKRKRR